MPHKNTGKTSKQLRVYKFRAYPSRDQEAAMEQLLRDCCTLYNAALEERIQAYRMARKRLSMYDQTYQIKPMRDDGIMPIASFTAARDVLYRVDLAFGSFFRRLRSGEKPGFPRFHGADRYDSVTWGNYATKLPQATQGVMLHLRGPRAERVRIRRHRPVLGEVKTATLKRHAGRWWVCLNAEQEAAATIPHQRDTRPAIGVFLEPEEERVTLSDGQRRYRIPSRREWQREQDRLTAAQRRLAYYWSPQDAGHQAPTPDSKTQRRRRVQYQRLHEAVHQRRVDWWHKLSRELAQRYEVIAVARHKPLKDLAQEGYGIEVNDAGWGQLLQFCRYKAAAQGGEVREVDIYTADADDVGEQVVAQRALAAAMRDE